MAAQDAVACVDLDYCPTCGRLIRDYDLSGYEREDGQRWCIEHYAASLVSDHLWSPRTTRDRA